MKKSFNKIYLVILLFIVIVTVALLYFFRPQEIAMRFIPNEFTYCDKKIWDKHQQYNDIVLWLHENKQGWVRTFKTYDAKQVYQNPIFNIKLLDDAILISYKTRYAYPQYIKKVEHDFAMSCFDTE